MRLRRIAAAILAASLALSGAASGAELVAGGAQPGPPARDDASVVTLDRVLASLERHPLLRAADLGRDVAEGDLQSAEGAFDPTWRSRASAVPLGGYPTARLDTAVEVPTTLWGLTPFAGYRWGSEGFAPYDEKQETNELGEVRAGAFLPLWRNGPTDRRRANVERAEIGRRLAALSVAERRIELHRVASFRYWEWVAAGERLRLAREVLAVATDRSAQIAARAAAGDLPEIDHVENERAILQRRQQVVAAERALVKASLELSLYHRAPSGEPLVPAVAQLPRGFPAVAPPPAGSDADVRAAVARRPEIAALEGQRDQARIEREWAENQRAPAIDLGVVGSQDLGDGTEKRRPFELEVSLFVDIPLDRDVADGRVKASAALAARAEAQATFARQQIAAEVRDAVNAVEQARARRDLAASEVEVARRLEAAERERFELGDSSLLFVNLREQTTVEAAFREIDALLDVERSRAALEAAIGLRGAPSQPRR